MKLTKWQIFFTALKFSSITFGGGFVMIGMMEKKFVEEMELLNHEEMMDIAAIAQSSPGAVAVNAWILLGFRLAGLPGSLVAVLGAILPPFFIISILSLIYKQFITSSLVATIMKGMQIAVAAIISDLVINLFSSLAGDAKPWDFILVILALILILYYRLPVFILLLSFAAFGLWRKA